jgi:hypothetical protein
VIAGGGGVSSVGDRMVGRGDLPGLLGWGAC